MGKVIKIISKYREILMYLIFGILTTIVSLSSYYVLTFTILNPKNAMFLQVANIVSWMLSVLFAYFTNRKYVFNCKKGKNLREFSSFVSGRVLTLIVDIIIMFVFVTVLKFDDKLLKLFSQITVIVLNYIISKFLVFNEKGGNIK